MRWFKVIEAQRGEAAYQVAIQDIHRSKPDDVHVHSGRHGLIELAEPPDHRFPTAATPHSSCAAAETGWCWWVPRPCWAAPPAGDLHRHQGICAQPGRKPVARTQAARRGRAQRGARRHRHTQAACAPQCSGLNTVPSSVQTVDFIGGVALRSRDCRPFCGTLHHLLAATGDVRKLLHTLARYRKVRP